MKRVKLLATAALFFGALAFGCMDAACGARAVEELPPDFTQGGKKDDSHDWLLGPTGARGWVFSCQRRGR